MWVPAHGYVLPKRGPNRRRTAPQEDGMAIRARQAKKKITFPVRGGDAVITIECTGSAALATLEEVEEMIANAYDDVEDFDDTGDPEATPVVVPVTKDVAKVTLAMHKGTTVRVVRNED